MAISYKPVEKTKKLAALRKDVGGVATSEAGANSCVTPSTAGTQALPANTFINTTNHGLKVKMPDSVHIFLPGETIEFLPKELGEDGADRELARRARRAEMKSKASMDWAKRNKGK